MKSHVGIAELKAHLSEYVRAAQGGAEITIRDRHTPVAKLMPAVLPGDLGEIRNATRPMADVQRMLDASPSKALLFPGNIAENPGRGTIRPV